MLSKMEELATRQRMNGHRSVSNIYISDLFRRTKVSLLSNHKSEVQGGLSTVIYAASAGRPRSRRRIEEPQEPPKERKQTDAKVVAWQCNVPELSTCGSLALELRFLFPTGTERKKSDPLQFMQCLFSFDAIQLSSGYSQN